MVNIRQTRLFSMPLRAAFAFFFLIFSAAQPAMFASSGTEGVGHGLAMTVALAEQADGHAHVGGHTHGSVHDDEASSTAKGSDAAGDNCQVHCAPVHAMPVACPDIAPGSARCFAPIASDSLKAGEPTDHIRPPRRLT
jgi:hypothetical protein